MNDWHKFYRLYYGFRAGTKRPDTYGTKPNKQARNKIKECLRKVLKNLDNYV